MDKRGEIKAKRDAASRARRLAAGVDQDDVHRRMLAFAAALDAEADELERQLATIAAPQVTQIQMQMQQGPPAKDNGEDGELMLEIQAYSDRFEEGVALHVLGLVDLAVGVAFTVRYNGLELISGRVVEVEDKLAAIESKGRRWILARREAANGPAPTHMAWQVAAALPGREKLAADKIAAKTAPPAGA